MPTEALAHGPQPTFPPLHGAFFCGATALTARPFSRALGPPAIDDALLQLLGPFSGSKADPGIPDSPDQICPSAALLPPDDSFLEDDVIAGKSGTVMSFQEFQSRTPRSGEAVSALASAVAVGVVRAFSPSMAQPETAMKYANSWEMMPPMRRTLPKLREGVPAHLDAACHAQEESPEALVPVGHSANQEKAGHLLQQCPVSACRVRPHKSRRRTDSNPKGPCPEYSRQADGGLGVGEGRLGGATVQVLDADEDKANEGPDAIGCCSTAPSQCPRRPKQRPPQPLRPLSRVSSDSLSPHSLPGSPSTSQLRRHFPRSMSGLSPSPSSSPLRLEPRGTQSGRWVDPNELHIDLSKVSRHRHRRCCSSNSSTSEQLDSPGSSCEGSPVNKLAGRAERHRRIKSLLRDLSGDHDLD